VKFGEVARAIQWLVLAFGVHAGAWSWKGGVELRHPNGLTRSYLEVVHFCI
jgi:hypothetical protein